MKRFIVALAALAGAALFAQAPTPQYIVNGVYNPNAFGQYRILVTTPVAAAGSATITIPETGVVLPNGPSYAPISATTPIYVQDGANSEIVAPTSVSCSANSCSFAGTFANAHPGNFWITSGSFGLQEAINWAFQQGGGRVQVDAQWRAAANASSTLPGGTTPAGVITGAAGYYNVVVNDMSEDVTHNFHSYVWHPTAVTQISAPTAPTLTKITGSLTSGTYYASGACVDAMGGISLPSTSNNDVTTATGISIAVPAGCTAANGAVGWLPYITAASGSDGTEILVTNDISAGATYTVNSTVCTLTNLEAVFPACSLTSAATALKAQTGTSLEVVESTAFKYWAYVPTTATLAPFVQVYPFGTFVVGGTISSSNEDVAQFQVPAGFLNQLGKGLEICVKGATATQVSSSVLTIAVNITKNYGQTGVTGNPSFLFATQTMAAAGTQAGCVDVVTALVGTSGKFAIQTPGPWTNVLNSTPAEVTKTSTDVTAALTGTLDLTQVLYFSINYAEGAGDNITAPIAEQVFIRVIE